MDSSSERRFLLPVVLAIVVLAVIGAITYALIPHHITQISVDKVDLFAPHTEMQAMQGSTHVLGQAAESEDDLYVVAHLNIADKLSQPIIIAGWSATATFADGGTLDATIVARSELPRLEQIFPQITPLVTQPIGYLDEIYPGKPDSGSIVLLFPNMTQDRWNSKRSAVLTLELHEHESQTVKLP
jgi:hypothetical protein